jgi:ABC-type glycerol-3-phosphate transport system permease component
VTEPQTLEPQTLDIDRAALVAVGASQGRRTPWRQRAATRGRLGDIAVFLVLILGSVAVLLPFFWQVSTSLKDEFQVNQIPPMWIPHPIHPDNYVTAFSELPFNYFVRNTMIIEVGVLVGTLLSATMAAYAFARLNAPFKNTLFIIVLSTMMLPGIITLVPSYFIFVKLGWVDTLLPLIVPAWFGGGAFNIFLLRQFFLSIPGELADAAAIDGAGTLKTIFLIFVPLAKPALAAVAIMTFIGVWHDFFGPLIYLNSEHNFTLALGINEFIQENKTGAVTQWPLVMAASTAIIVPPLALFLFFQRFFIEGILLGSTKG